MQKVGGVARRIALTLAANAFGQAINIASQLVLTPLFFAHWGAGRFGEWLLLSSIPTYLSVADIGFASAAANEMAIQSGAGSLELARRTFRVALRIAAIASSVALGLGALLAASTAYFSLPRLQEIAPFDAALVLLLLAACVAATFASNLAYAGFRASHHNAFSVLLMNCSRMAEMLVQMALLLRSTSVVGLAAAILLVRLATVALQFHFLRSRVAWLLEPTESFDRGILLRLAKPSLAFLSFPLGSALSIQGPLIVLGTAFGGTAVAAFSTLRTLTRIPVQVTNALNNSVWPEVSRAWGAGDLDLVRRLHRGTTSITLLFTILASLVLAFVGRAACRIWLHGQDIYEPSLFTALLLLSIPCALWNSSYVTIGAINRHVRAGIGFVAINVFAIGAAYLFARQIAALGIAYVMLAADTLMAIYVIRESLRMSGDHLPDYLISIGSGEELRTRIIAIMHRFRKD